MEEYLEDLLEYFDNYFNEGQTRIGAPSGTEDYFFHGTFSTPNQGVEGTTLESVFELDGLHPVEMLEGTQHYRNETDSREVRSDGDKVSLSKTPRHAFTWIFLNEGLPKHPAILGVERGEIDESDIVSQSTWEVQVGGVPLSDIDWILTDNQTYRILEEEVPENYSLEDVYTVNSPDGRSVKDIGLDLAESRNLRHTSEQLSEL